MSIDPKSLNVLALPSVSLHERHTLPALSAIYFVVTDDYDILYIGQATVLHRRWKTHNRLKQFQAFDNIHIAWLAVDDSSLLPVIEKALIVQFNPPYNGTVLR